MSDLTTTITGNLADDPELRYTQSGVAVATIRVGINNRTYNKTTQQYEDGETTWIHQLCNLSRRPRPQVRHCRLVTLVDKRLLFYLTKASGSVIN